MTIEQHINMAKIREAKAEALKPKLNQAAADEDWITYKRLFREYETERAMARKHVLCAEARRIGIF